MSKVNDQFEGDRYRHIWYESSDGLRLYARDYSYEYSYKYSHDYSPGHARKDVEEQPGDNTKPTIVCLHGLTRNSADFEFLCEHLSDKYRVIAADQRGRGLSAYDSNPENYHPGVYVRDMLRLFDVLDLNKIVLIGTSLGGLMSLLIAALQPERIQALILNDVGPEVNPAGLARIQAYVGKQRTVESWCDAVAQAREINATEFPDLDDKGWRTFTRAIYRENSEGKPELAYDPSIAIPMDKNSTVAVPENLWPQFELVVKKSLLVLRGQTSDILTPGCVRKMQSKKLDMSYCEIPNRGHAPLLSEPSALQAIDRFLAEL